MIFESKVISYEHLDLFLKMSHSAKSEMIDVRPGWSYRGPIKNGNILLNFYAWEKERFHTTTAMQTRKDSYLDKQIDSIPYAHQNITSNWRYCIKNSNNYENHGFSALFKALKRSRSNLPNHACFITNNLEWLLETSAGNLNKVGVGISKVKSDKDSKEKTITFFADEEEYIGTGSTLNLAALMLYGKTFDIKYELERPSISQIKGKEINITNLVEDEPTVEVTDPLSFNFVNDLKLYNYQSLYVSREEMTVLSDKYDEYTYYGKFHFVEGDFHLVKPDGNLSLYSMF